MIFKRQQFVNQLIEHLENNMIKVVTGIRRCSKSYLLFELSFLQKTNKNQ